jgi:hypothetical protein
MLMPIRIGSVIHGGEQLSLFQGTYINGGTALMATDALGSAYATISVWLPDSPKLPHDMAWIKTWSENAPITNTLRGGNMFSDTGLRKVTGFVEAELWQIHWKYFKLDFSGEGGGIHYVRVVDEDALRFHGSGARSWREGEGVDYTRQEITQEEYHNATTKIDARAFTGR